MIRTLQATPSDALLSLAQYIGGPIFFSQDRPPHEQNFAYIRKRALNINQNRKRYTHWNDASSVILLPFSIISAAIDCHLSSRFVMFLSIPSRVPLQTPSKVFHRDCTWIQFREVYLARNIEAGRLVSHQLGSEMRTKLCIFRIPKSKQRGIRSGGDDGVLDRAFNQHARIIPAARRLFLSLGRASHFVEVSFFLLTIPSISTYKRAKVSCSAL